jgi:hypothetical protein
VPGTFGDPVRVIQTLPGVARTPFGLGFLLIRGSNPDDSAVYIDGHKVPLLFHFLGGPSVLNPEMLEEIELYPAATRRASAARHGGVVALETRAAVADGVHGSADVDLLDAGGYIRAPLSKRWAIAVAGRRSYLDFFLGLVVPEPDPGRDPDRRAGLLGHHDPRRLGRRRRRQGRAVRHLLERHPRRGPGRGRRRAQPAAQQRDPVRAADRALPAADRPRLDADDVAGGRPRLGLLRRRPDRRRRAVLGRRGDRLHVQPPPPRQGPAQPSGCCSTSAPTSTRASPRYQATVPDDLNIRGGDDIDIDPSPISRSVETLGVALHADLAWQVTPKLRLLPGLRVDGYVIQAQPMLTVDPRLTARYQLTPTKLLKGYAGVFHQPPQPEAVDARFGNPDVRSERGLHFGLGGEWRPNRLWLVDGEVYYIDRADLVHFTNDAEVDGGTVTPERVINSGTSSTYGLEALIKREISDTVYGWLSYTYSHSVQQRFPTARTVPTAFDQAHNLNAVVSGSRAAAGSWAAGCGCRPAGPRRRTSAPPSTPTAAASCRSAAASAPRAARTSSSSTSAPRRPGCSSCGAWASTSTCRTSPTPPTRRPRSGTTAFASRPRCRACRSLPTLGVRGAW